MQWVVLPAVPAAWLIFGVLLCLATVVTKNIVQPPLYSHRPIPVFSCEFLRWWLVQRLISVTNLMFADQLRGTAYLAWWFRALVRASTSYHLHNAIPASLSLRRERVLLFHCICTV